MNSRGFSYSLLKILSVWIFVDLFLPNFISGILVFIKPFSEHASYSSDTIVYWIIQSVVYLILSLILWFSANKMSLLILGRYDENNEILKLNFQQNKILETGLILIGFY